MSERWAVKRRHYAGGTSVVSLHDCESDARKYASSFNYQYMSDQYYVEKWQEC